MIVATAGHVDHGKTALVRNLTGVETDRLEEEQLRGLSINLGYAYKQLVDNKALGFIDVPGHRRFINTMISGVSGIDLGMLVVAADDGPMPQTTEHIDIMRLLGVQEYMLVISKCDRVDESRIALVGDAVSKLLPRDTPIHRVSNTTGMGLTDLKNALKLRAVQCANRSSAGHFRMSIDRSFNLQGQGLILTGTIASGCVAIGETLRIQPQNKTIRVRAIHTQDKPSPTGQAGERCALKVSGDLHKDEIERGDWIVSPSCIKTTNRFDVRFHLLENAAITLKHLSQVKLHLGAKHLDARVMFLHRGDGSSERIQPGDSVLAQISTARPVHCCHGDRFLLRDYGETSTLGGGTVLDPLGPRKHRSSPARLRFLAAQEQNDIEGAISQTLRDKYATLDYGALLKAWNIDSEESPGLELEGIARITTDSGRHWITEPHWRELKQNILDALRSFHEREPGEQGSSVASLISESLPVAKQHFFAPALEALLQANAVTMRNGLVCISGHEAAPTCVEQDDWLTVSACLQKCGSQIPLLSALESECGLTEETLRQTLGRAQKSREVIKISPRRYATIPVIGEYAQAALHLTEEKPMFTLMEYRDHLKLGRNLALEMLEYFDSIRLTQRVGNARKVINRNLPAKRFEI